jgi:hypothetical protein
MTDTANKKTFARNTASSATNIVFKGQKLEVKNRRKGRGIKKTMPLSDELVYATNRQPHGNKKSFL